MTNDMESCSAMRNQVESNKSHGFNFACFFQGPSWGKSQGPLLLQGVAAVLMASAKPFHYDAACAQGWYLMVPASGPGSTTFAPGA